MSANVGVALSLVTQPQVYVDPDLSTRVRDAVHSRLLVSTDPSVAPASDIAATGLQLSAQLRAAPRPSLTSAELALLHEWLGRLAAHDTR